MMLLQSWHPNFNLSTESFTIMPIWVCLSNFPFFIGSNHVLQLVQTLLGNFVSIDDSSKYFIHTTFARILVELDPSKDLPIETILNVNTLFMTQPLTRVGFYF